MLQTHIPPTRDISSVTLSTAHADSVWGLRWTANDTVVSISADGTIKQYNSTSGQPSHSLPPHTLGLVSLDVDPTGRLALYNTLEGLTSLWNLESGEVVGRYESYARGASDPVEPGMSRLSTPIRPYVDGMLSQAWAVSLDPKGGTYASTGGSGNVTIHSAEGTSFGERRATLASGRNKFGMSCKYVGHHCPCS